MNEESLKTRLRNIAVEKKITPDKVWKQLQLERFLARLSASPYKTKFILKGALLLAQYIPINRETIDVDFLLNKLDMAKIESAIKDVILINLEDGFDYHWYAAEELTQPHMEYKGFRFSLNVKYGQMKDKIQIDIGIGDIVEPIETQYDVLKYKGEPLFDEQVSLLAYPPETIFAEKLETIISKGSNNSRMKDYHDVLMMIQDNYILDSHYVTNAIHQTFERRGTTVKSLIKFEQDDLRILQENWQSHLRGVGILREKIALPDEIDEVIKSINVLLKTLDL